MSTLLATYPYLCGCVMLLGLSAAALRLVPDQRRPMLLSGLLSLPFALLALELVPEYWHPTRVAVVLIGLEDGLFSFTTGLLAWSVAVFPVRRRLVLRRGLSSCLRSYGGFVLLGFVLHVACRVAGLRGVESHLLPATVVGAVLLSLRPSLWPIPLIGGVCFTIVHLAIAVSVISFQPHLISIWNGAGVSGALLLGVPIEEVWWACGFGATFPLLVASALDAGLSLSPSGAVARPARDKELEGFPDTAAS